MQSIALSYVPRHDSFLKRHSAVMTVPFGSVIGNPSEQNTEFSPANAGQPILKKHVSRVASSGISAVHVIRER
jgi:hypothetical protein